MAERTKEKLIEQITLLELFVTFTQLSLCGFGGVGPWIYRFIVEKKQWMNSDEFTELLSLGQVLPGANVTNFAAMFGYRVKGVVGSVAAITGLLFIPFFIVISLGLFYEKLGYNPSFQGALRGILSVSAGMIILTGIKLARDQKNKNNKSIQLLLALLTLLSITVINISLPMTVFVVFLIGFLFHWKIIK